MMLTLELSFRMSSMSISRRLDSERRSAPNGRRKNNRAENHLWPVGGMK